MQWGNYLMFNYSTDTSLLCNLTLTLAHGIHNIEMPVTLRGVCLIVRISWLLTHSPRHNHDQDASLGVHRCSYHLTVTQNAAYSSGTNSLG